MRKIFLIYTLFPLVLQGSHYGDSHDKWQEFDTSQVKKMNAMVFDGAWTTKGNDAGEVAQVCNLLDTATRLGRTKLPGVSCQFFFSMLLARSSNVPHDRYAARWSIKLPCNESNTFVVPDWPEQRDPTQWPEDPRCRVRIMSHLDKTLVQALFAERERRLRLPWSYTMRELQGLFNESWLLQILRNFHSDEPEGPKDLIFKGLPHIQPPEIGDVVDFVIILDNTMRDPVNAPFCRVYNWPVLEEEPIAPQEGLEVLQEEKVDDSSTVRDGLIHDVLRPDRGEQEIERQRLPEQLVVDNHLPIRLQARGGNRCCGCVLQ